MEYIENRFRDEERKAYDCFKAFAASAAMIYNKYYPTDYGEHYDVLACNHTGGTEIIELKLRGNLADKFKDCFIETHKYANLMNDWTKEGVMPIYMNFIGDENNVYVWYLPEIDESRMTLYKNVPIHQADGTIEYHDRYGLKWEDARHYIKGVRQPSPNAIWKNMPMARQYEIDFENNKIKNENKLYNDGQSDN